MTVQELINHLQQLDPNTIVFRHGYEGGYDIVNRVSSEVEMALNVYDSSYFGDHEQICGIDKENYLLEGKTIVKGIII
jgi:hypothetical protein